LGSHVARALARAGYAPLILDNLANSSRAVLPRLERLTGAHIPLIVADVRDRAALARTFAEHRIDAVVHCAGLKAVAEGEAEPLAYYDNNVTGSIALALAKRRRTRPTIGIRASPKSRRGDDRTSTCSEMTIRRPTGPACATTSTLPTSPRATPRPLRISSGSRASRH